MMAPTSTGAVATAGWPAAVKGDLNSSQRGLVAGVWPRYVRYKEAYFADGWPLATACVPDPTVEPSCTWAAARSDWALMSN